MGEFGMRNESRILIYSFWIPNAASCYELIAFMSLKCRDERRRIIRETYSDWLRKRSMELLDPHFASLFLLWVFHWWAQHVFCLCYVEGCWRGSPSNIKQCLVIGGSDVIMAQQWRHWLSPKCLLFPPNEMDSDFGKCLCSMRGGRHFAVINSILWDNRISG